tara:strand:- start:5888 stop:6355 length:468 start_codon:yes stop_codon:yes gene_type:complete
MKKNAIFPGSFDPFTKGHQDLVHRALPLFDKIIISIGVNSKKKSLFSIKQRIEWIQKVFINEPKVIVDSYKGLTVDFCKEKNATFIIRGVRNIDDLKFESNIAQMNADLAQNIETLFLISRAEKAHISSSIIRDIIKNKGKASRFLPKEINIKTK